MDVRPADAALSTLFAMQVLAMQVLAMQLLAMQVLASFDELTLPTTINPY